MPKARRRTGPNSASRIITGFCVPHFRSVKFRVLNGLVTLVDTGFPSSTTQTNFLWDDFNKLIFTKGYNTNNVKLSVSMKDGEFKGSFLEFPAYPTSVRKIQGAVLQEGPMANTAWGTFLSITNTGTALIQALP